MHRLTKLSFGHRSVVLLVALLALVAGLYCTTTLKQELIPSMDLPRGSVITVYAGASPEVVEAEVTKPIEAAVQGVAGVTQVTSTSASNVSTVTLQWDYADDADAMATSIQRAV
ncbi:MAG: efflux RND transporter permease subunit, partial [Propionibacteriaceae bacterium]|nr:efflux RND transporter permease subunit [Propionibacteriaceae bacterium]